MQQAAAISAAMQMFVGLESKDERFHFYARIFKTPDATGDWPLDLRVVHATKSNANHLLSHLC